MSIFKETDEMLGLTIAGGKENNYDRIFIKSVIPDSIASKSKKLKSGDIILSVNDINLHNISHTDAIQYLKSVIGVMRLVIISCPGSLI